MSEIDTVIDNIDLLINNNYVFFNMSNFSGTNATSTSSSSADREPKDSEEGNTILINGISLPSFTTYIPEIFRKNTQDKSVELLGEKKIRRYLYRMVTTNYVKKDKSRVNKKVLRSVLRNKIERIDDLTFDGLYSFLQRNNQSYFVKMLKLVLFCINSNEQFSKGSKIKPLKLHYMAQYYFYNKDPSTYNDIDEYKHKYYQLTNFFNQKLGVIFYRNFIKDAIVKWTTNDTAYLNIDDPTLPNFFYYVLDTLSLFYKFVLYYNIKTDISSRRNNLSIYQRKYPLTDDDVDKLGDFHEEFSDDGIFGTPEYGYIGSYDQL